MPINHMMLSKFVKCLIFWYIYIYIFNYVEERLEYVWVCQTRCGLYCQISYYSNIACLVPKLLSLCNFGPHSFFGSLNDPKLLKFCYNGHFRLLVILVKRWCSLTNFIQKLIKMTIVVMFLIVEVTQAMEKKKK